MDETDRSRLRTAIAEIMGHKVAYGYDDTHLVIVEVQEDVHISYDCPDYPGDIAAAWQVLDYATKIENMATLVNPVTGFPAGSHIAYAWKDLNLWTYSAEEAAEKICLMIYKAAKGRDFE